MKNITFIVLLVLSGGSAFAGTSYNWATGGGCWTTSGNWSCNAVPCSGDDAEFGNCATGAAGSTHTIDLCGSSPGCEHKVNTLTVNSCNNYTFQFTNGCLWLNCHTSVINGKATFTSGGVLTSRSASGKDLNIADCNGSTGHLTIDGACSTAKLRDVIIACGNGASATLELKNGSTATIRGTAMGNNGSATLIVDNSHYYASGNVCVGNGNCSNSYLKITNGGIFEYADCGLPGNSNMNIGNADGAATTIVLDAASTMTIGGDIDLVSNACATATTELCISGNSTLRVGEDIILGRGDGSATINVSGACTSVCVCGALAIGQSGGDGYLLVTCGADFHVKNTNNCATSSAYGGPGACNASTIVVSNGAVLTHDDSGCLNIAENTTLIIDGGTHNGTVGLTLSCGALIRADGCYGAGTLTNDIELKGGTFNDGTAAGETLVISGSITQAAAGDDLFINGLGTIALGSNNMIDNAIDIQIDGGVLSTGTGAGFDETVQNVTLNSASTIDLGTGGHELRMDDLLLAGNTLTITGWEGTGGSAGTAGRLLIAKSSMSLNGGSSGTNLAGINFSGFGTNYDIISYNGSFWEVVPYGAPVPEPSTWIVGGTLALFAAYDFRRRRSRRNVS